MTGVTKRFPGSLALNGVQIDVAPGEIHALLGENGAGKSTLLKILSGAQSPDSGSIQFAGSSVSFAVPHDAHKLGIVTIYQEFTLAPNMTIAENVFLGREPGRKPFVSRRKMAARTSAITKQLGLDLKSTSMVRDLAIAEQQLVEIARALSIDSRLIVMDEPTAALSSAEVEKLFAIMRDLRARGLSIIFVTHRIEEVFRICDSYTVLRDGKHVGRGAVAETTTKDIIRLMVGREVNTLYARRERSDKGDVALRVTGLSRRGSSQDQKATVLNNISLEVRQGEILGIAGLVGAGRTELARAVFGVDAFDAGSISVAGQSVVIRTPQDAIRHGIGLVPEDRKQQALFLSLAVRPNLTMAAHDLITHWGLFISDKTERALVSEFQKRMNIRMINQEQIIADLSGGNQQKVVLARWLALRPKVLIVDEPTRGIDVGAKVEVHNLLFELATTGIAIIAISSELPEILAISDRIIVLREGRVTGEIDSGKASEERLMGMMALGNETA